MPDICIETTNFIRACEALHTRLVHQRLTHDDRDIIEFGCVNLLTKLRPELRTASA
jgi:hypothetical protein